MKFVLTSLGRGATPNVTNQRAELHKLGKEQARERERERERSDKEGAGPLPGCLRGTIAKRGDAHSLRPERV